MLAPLVIDLLIGCSLLLLAGWATDALDARAHALHRRLAADSSSADHWARRERPWWDEPLDDPAATATVMTSEVVSDTF